jgi:hypothetical protein
MVQGQAPKPAVNLYAVSEAINKDESLTTHLTGD